MGNSELRNPLWVRFFFGAPYLAVLVGMYWFHNAFLSILLYHGLIALPLLLNRRDWTCSIDLKNIHWPGVSVAILVGLAAGPALLILWPWMELPGSAMEKTLADFGLSGGSRWVFLLYFCTFHPFWEEAFWRFLDREKKLSHPLADLFFAGYHLLVLPFFIRQIWLLPALLILWTAGILWRWILRKYKDSLSVLLSHALADGSILAVVFWRLAGS